MVIMKDVVSSAVEFRSAALCVCFLLNPQCKVTLRGKGTFPHRKWFAMNIKLCSKLAVSSCLLLPGLLLHLLFS
jgi:hypothetical protein